MSEVARRSPGFGALVASLPLISVLGMIWLWRDTHDPARMAGHVHATLWYVMPLLPMFAIMPVLIHNGGAFLYALAAGCALTIALYAVITLVAARLGIAL